jgi:hypothetical protein
MRDVDGRVREFGGAATHLEYLPLCRIASDRIQLEASHSAACGVAGKLTARQFASDISHTVHLQIPALEGLFGTSRPSICLHV